MGWKARPSRYLKLSYPQTRIKACFVYHERYTYNGASASQKNNSWAFRGNDPYDPYAGLGNFGSMQLQLSSYFFNTIYCYASKITLNFKSESSATGGFNVLVTPQPANVIPTLPTSNPNVWDLYNSYKSTPGTKLVQMTRMASGGVMTIRGFQTTRRMFPNVDTRYSPSFFQTYNTSPTSSWYWNVIGVGGYTSDSSNLPAHELDVVIKYYCILTSPVNETHQ